MGRGLAHSPHPARPAADLVVVVPATAHTIARYAAGLSDDLLTATLLATRAPVLVCPAMHTEMWEHPSVRDNLATPERRGVEIIPPESGRLAGGDNGEGRLADPAAIVERILARLGTAPRQRDLDGIRIARERRRHPRTARSRAFHQQPLVGQAGPRRWPLRRPRRGRGVTLVTSSPLHFAADVASTVPVDVETAADMEQAMQQSRPTPDVVVMAAAVADFRPKATADDKLSKEDGIPELVLEPTPDILAGLAACRRPDRCWSVSRPRRTTRSSGPAQAGAQGRRPPRR